MQYCKLCKQSRKLVKSHILSEVFYRAIDLGGPSLTMYPTDPNLFPKKSPIGAYDKILCNDCEVSLGVYDDYAQEIFLKKFDAISNPIIVGGDVSGYEIKSYDYKKMKLFFISLLWRASVSDHYFFRDIKLGDTYEATARKYIRNGFPGINGQDFAVIISKFNDKIIGHKFMLNPHRWRLDDGINFCNFYLGSGIQTIIKVDKRDTKKPFDALVLRDNSPLLIVARDFEKSQELQMFLKNVQNF